MSSNKVKTLAEAVDASMIATTVLKCILGRESFERKAVETAGFARLR